MNMKDVNGYEGLYAVTEDGRVWSYRKKKFLQARENNSGYLMVNLYDKEGKPKTQTIHRIVLKTFNPVEGMENLEASHIDEDRLNNCLSNLEWIDDHRENCNMPLYKTRVGAKGIPRKHKPVKCIETGEIYKNMMDAERATGIHHNLIWRVVKGQRNTAGGYHWCYAN